MFGFPLIGYEPNMTNETKSEVTEVIDALMQTLQDGILGFKNVAAKAADDGRNDIAITFEHLAIQREQFQAQLATYCDEIGHDWKRSGSLIGTLHRGWTDIGDAVTGSPNVLLDAAETGETHTINAYEDAVSRTLPDPIFETVRRQLSEVVKTRNDIRLIPRQI
jgi:uncharacterized protein (TIGR02284 family)